MHRLLRTRVLVLCSVALLVLSLVPAVRRLATRIACGACALRRPGMYARRVLPWQVASRALEGPAVQLRAAKPPPALGGWCLRQRSQREVEGGRQVSGFGRGGRCSEARKLRCMPLTLR